MKRIASLFFAATLLTTLALAMGSAPPSAMNTGDAELDSALQEIEAQANDPAQEAEIESIMVKEYGVTQKEIDALRKRGYRVSEVYYMCLLARQSGRKVNSVAALHAQGAGWGTLAHRLNVHPGDLNRLRARHHRMRKHMIRQQRRLERAPRIKPAKPPRGRR